VRRFEVRKKCVVYRFSAREISDPSEVDVSGSWLKGGVADKRASYRQTAWSTQANDANSTPTRRFVANATIVSIVSGKSRRFNGGFSGTSYTMDFLRLTLSFRAAPSPTDSVKRSPASARVMCIRRRSLAVIGPKLNGTPVDRTAQPHGLPSPANSASRVARNPRASQTSRCPLGSARTNT